MVRTLWMIIILLVGVETTFALQVTVYPSVVVKGDQVLVKDVADLSSPLPRLAHKRVARSPAPGKSTQLGRDRIKNVLLQNGIDPDEVHFSGAESVDVKRDSLVISATKIKRDIDTYLSEVQKKTPAVQFNFTAQGRVKECIVPAGNLTVEVIPSLERVIGSRRFTLIYRIDGRTVKNISVSGKLEVLGNVVVAQRTLKRNGIVGYADVGLASMDISKIDQPFFDIDNVVGKKVVRSVRSGQVVEEKNLDFPPLVKKGGFVKLIARRGHLMLTATGIARQDGKMDEMIRVRNSSSQKEVLAKVVGPDKVEVGF